MEGKVKCCLCGNRVKHSAFIRIKMRECPGHPAVDKTLECCVFCANSWINGRYFKFKRSKPMNKIVKNLIHHTGRPWGWNRDVVDGGLFVEEKALMST